MSKLLLYFSSGVIYLLVTMLSPKPYLNLFIPFLLVMLSRLSFGVLLICFALLSMVYAGLSMGGFIEIYAALIILGLLHQYLRWDTSVVKYYFWRVLLWCLICETIFHIKWYGVLQISLIDRTLHGIITFICLLLWVFPLEFIHQLMERSIQRLVKRIFPQTEFSWINLRNLQKSNSNRNPFGFKTRGHF